jgi:hypothetical protein
MRISKTLEIVVIGNKSRLRKTLIHRASRIVRLISMELLDVRPIRLPANMSPAEEETNQRNRMSDIPKDFAKASDGGLRTTALFAAGDAVCATAIDPDYVSFCKAWEASGLPAYYERMDDLNRIGFRFDGNGDMDHYESEALSAWLGNDRALMSVSLAKIEAVKPSILASARLLSENAKVLASPPLTTPTDEQG